MTKTESDKEVETPVMWFGFRRSAILEIVLFLVVALAIDYLFFDGTRYRSAVLHPFWLLVLLVTVQYGTHEGMLAAALASVSLLAFNLPEQTLAQDRYDYLFQISRTPLMWFAAALIFGELRMRQIRERDVLRSDLGDAKQREEAIASDYKRLGQVKDSLEARIAGQVRTAITLSQAAKAIEKLDPSEVLFGVVDMVRAVMFPEKFSLYLLRNDLLELFIQEGGSPEDRFSQTFDRDSLLFQEVVGRQRLLCSANASDEQILGSEGVLAGPLINTAEGEVLGMLKVEKLGFLDLNFSNIHTFQLLCEWIATAYANALRYQTARSESVLSEETKLLSYGFLERQTAFLSELAERFHFNLSMIILHLENPDELSEEEMNLIPPALARTVRKVLRRSDMVFDHQRTGWEFALVLPGSPIENSPFIVEKLLAGLKTQLAGKASHARFTVTTQAIYKEEGRVERTLLSHDLFRQQTESLTNLARRMAFDFSLVVTRLENATELTEDERIAIPDQMNQVVRNLLALDDCAFAYRRSYWEFMIALPGTSIEGARTAAQEMIDTLENSTGAASRARFSFTIQPMMGRPFWEPTRV
jgi:GGDEF domain-containing protein